MHWIVSPTTFLLALGVVMVAAVIFLMWCERQHDDFEDDPDNPVGM